MMTDLADATEAIVQAVFDTIRNSADQLIKQVPPGSIILTDRTAAPKSYPSLWIVPGNGTITHDRSNTETWRLEIGLTAIVLLGKNPAKDIALARRLSNRAATLLMQDRRLGLPGTVQDVKKAGFATMAARAPDERTGLYAAATQINVVYNIREQIK